MPVSAAPARRGQAHNQPVSHNHAWGCTHACVQPEPAATSRIGSWALCCEAADARRRRLSVSCAAPNQAMPACGRSPINSAIRQSAINDRREHKAPPARGHITLQPDTHNSSTLPRGGGVGGSIVQRPGHPNKTLLAAYTVYGHRTNCSRRARDTHTCCHQQGQKRRVVWHRRGLTACWRQPKAANQAQLPCN